MEAITIAPSAWQNAREVDCTQTPADIFENKSKPIKVAKCNIRMYKKTALCCNKCIQVSPVITELIVPACAYVYISPDEKVRVSTAYVYSHSILSPVCKCVNMNPITTYSYRDGTTEYTLNAEVIPNGFHHDACTCASGIHGFFDRTLAVEIDPRVFAMPYLLTSVYPALRKPLRDNYCGRKSPQNLSIDIPIDTQLCTSLRPSII